MSGLSGWTPRPACRMRRMAGRHVTVVPFDGAAHGDALWAAFGGAEVNDRLRWFGWPTFGAAGDLVAHLERLAATEGWSTGVMETPTGRAVGFASYMREDAGSGVVEIGGIAHSAAMARTAMATEAHALLMGHAFGLGYRRYEWKCDAGNAPSRAAAARLGFTHEGIFRQHKVSNGRNRDTAWFSVIDGEWPALRDAFAAWLDPANLDAAGRQRRALADLRRPPRGAAARRDGLRAGDAAS